MGMGDGLVEDGVGGNWDLGLGLGIEDWDWD